LQKSADEPKTMAAAVPGILPVSPSRGRLMPLSDQAVQLTEGFWPARQQLNATTFLPHCVEWVERMGWIDNFRQAAQGRPSVERQGKLFTDSDVYKLLEALVWEAGRSGSDSVERRVQETTRDIAAAQEPDGYLNTYWGRSGLNRRYEDLAHGHELYCAGHLLQAVVARLRTHGPDQLAQVGRAVADRVCEDFGPDANTGIDGHPEIELGLAELYRATGESRYLEQARLFVERRGYRSLEPHPIGFEYYQDDLPIRQKRVLSGHVIRALYFAAGAVDVAVETDDDELLDAVIRQWDATIARRTYITGGMGARHLGESFGGDYELPPDRAYTESCGGVSSVMLAWRLLLATGEPRFADAMERALFNMVAAALDLSGGRFFYCNPLQQRTVGIVVGDDEVPFRKDTLRAPWFWVSCCPTNVARLLASLSAYFATTDESGIQLHHYGSSTVTAELASAGRVALRVQTDYPWEGTIRIEIVEPGAAPWELRLRVPAWAGGHATVTIDGDRSPAQPGYARIERQWHAGDRVLLELPVAARLSWPDPRIDAVRGTVAVERGPLVYALESPDLPEDQPLESVALETDAELSDGGTLAGLPAEITSVRASGQARRLPRSGSWPYSPDPATGEEPVPAELTLVPYHAWSNRGQSTMRVWIPTVGDVTGPSEQPPRGQQRQPKQHREDKRSG
jgi:DUF1680 family protein